MKKSKGGVWSRSSPACSSIKLNRQRMDEGERSTAAFLVYRREGRVLFVHAQGMDA